MGTGWFFRSCTETHCVKWFSFCVVGNYFPGGQRLGAVRCHTLHCTINMVSYHTISIVSYCTINMALRTINIVSYRTANMIPHHYTLP